MGLGLEFAALDREAQLLDGEAVVRLGRELSEFERDEFVLASARGDIVRPHLTGDRRSEHEIV